MKLVTLDELEEALSRPSDRDIAFMKELDGDLAILGASGKMGPSLVRLCRRANEAAGTTRRIIAVSRHPSKEPGVALISCDLLDRKQVASLPKCPNVLYLAGRKFGSTGSPELTWAMNALVPASVAEAFHSSRIVAFSTGNVYEFRRPSQGGSRETDEPAPVGEYAQSCLARERVFQYFANTHGLQCLLYRLNYAVDLRYGVPVDIARKVYAGQPVTLKVPAFNAIWQRDANSYALRALAHCASPAAILNAAGVETYKVRDVAEYFAKRFGRACRFEDDEGGVALLNDASRCREWLGPPEVDGSQLLELVAAWVESGGASLEKPTHFEVSDGKF
jgi:nucleoside-diphosphate-sugar epimerase